MIDIQVILWYNVVVNASNKRRESDMAKVVTHVCDGCGRTVITRTKPRGWHSRRDLKGVKYILLCVDCDEKRVREKEKIP